MDQAKYKSWSNKSLPENLRPAAHILSFNVDWGGREGKWKKGGGEIGELVEGGERGGEIGKFEGGKEACERKETGG